MHWPQPAANPDVVDRVTARTSTGLLASLFKQFLSNFTREWTRSGRAVAGPKGIHALVPPCFTCLCGRFCDCAHDQQGTEDTLKQFLQGHSMDVRSYVVYTWVERMRHHRTGRGDLRTKGHPCMHWPQHAAHAYVVDSVTACTSTGLLASCFKQFLSNFTREWTRSGRAVAKWRHAQVPRFIKLLFTFSIHVLPVEEMKRI